MGCKGILREGDQMPLCISTEVCKSAVQAQCGLRLDRWLEVTLKLSLDYLNVELVGFEVFRYF